MDMSLRARIVRAHQRMVEAQTERDRLIRARVQREGVDRAQLARDLRKDLGDDWRAAQVSWIVQPGPLMDGQSERDARRSTAVPEQLIWEMYWRWAFCGWRLKRVEHFVNKRCPAARNEPREFLRWRWAEIDPLLGAWRDRRRRQQREYMRRRRGHGARPEAKR